MTDLAISCRLTTPNGWLDVNDGLYRLSSDAFGESATTWRRREASNPFVEGTWTVSAVRENITEQLSVWVRGDFVEQTSAAVEELLNALSQRNFGLEVTFDGVQRFYTCFVADSRVLASGPMRASRMAQVVAEIPRHPVFTETPVNVLPSPLLALDGGLPNSDFSGVILDSGGA
jgi:hypothetical protein